MLDRGRPYGWALLGEGICVLNRRAKRAPAIEFYRFSTQRLEDVAELPETAGNSIALSPDGQRLLYTQKEYESSDIMLVENFR